jgi:hypothetical protein
MMLILAVAGGAQNNSTGCSIIQLLIVQFNVKNVAKMRLYNSFTLTKACQSILLKDFIALKHFVSVKKYQLVFFRLLIQALFFGPCFREDSSTQLCTCLKFHGNLIKTRLKLKLRNRFDGTDLTKRSHE